MLMSCIRFDRPSSLLYFFWQKFFILFFLSNEISVASLIIIIVNWRSVYTCQVEHRLIDRYYFKLTNNFLYLDGKWRDPHESMWDLETGPHFQEVSVWIVWNNYAVRFRFTCSLAHLLFKNRTAWYIVLASSLWCVTQ